MANKYKINITPIATTSITTVYTCPAENVALVKSISAYNTHPSSTSDWILKVYDNSASAAYVYKGEAGVAAAAKKEFLQGDESTLVVLEESDALHFQTTVTSANVFVSVLEQDRT
jgi:hypothetical protein|tara:strand:+ start:1003 stop:1347 length:345 start_codon:yes stop_codon:yes gene_type:complete